MNKWRVLVCDDSAFMRRSLSDIICGDSRFEVVAVARNGRDAVEKVKHFLPDVITMDVEMPEMNGLEAVEVIMRDRPTPIIMVSTLTDSGANETIRALQLGAVDCVHKDSILRKPSPSMLNEFYNRLEVATTSKPMNPRSDLSVSRNNATSRTNYAKMDLDAIVIGCSTGGPAALEAILPHLQSHLYTPVIVAQHMPKGFTRALARRFNGLCKVPVKEIESGEVLRHGHVYVVPSGYQLHLEQHTGQNVMLLSTSSPIETRFYPSVDVTMTTCASVFGSRMLAIILTGMGSDGTKGCEEVKRRGGYVYSQDEGTSVVYGMPRSVFEAGLSDRQISLGEIICVMETEFSMYR